MAKVIKGRVSIRDFYSEDIIANINPSYSEHTKEIGEAIDYHYSNCLSYNCDTGVSRNKDIGVLSRYSNSEEIPAYESLNDVLVDEFIPLINDTISRLLRGYTA